MSIACHWFLIVKFHDHHGLCGFMAHWDFIRWLLIRWCSELTPSSPGWQSRVWKEDQLACFSFMSFLVLSRCEMSLHWLWMIFGRSGRLTLHITSRNVKASSFRLHYFAHIYFLRFISLGGMGNHLAILLVMDFTIWYTDIWIYVDCVSLIPDC